MKTMKSLKIAGFCAVIENLECLNTKQECRSFSCNIQQYYGRGTGLQFLESVSYFRYNVAVQ
jgi:hypothetical protein